MAHRPSRMASGTSTPSGGLLRGPAEFDSRTTSPERSPGSSPSNASPERVPGQAKPDGRSDIELGDHHGAAADSAGRANAKMAELVGPYGGWSRRYHARLEGNR